MYFMGDPEDTNFLPMKSLSFIRVGVAVAVWHENSQFRNTKISPPPPTISCYTVYCSNQ